jgi:hypothetical protein
MDMNSFVWVAKKEILGGGRFSLQMLWARSAAADSPTHIINRSSGQTLNLDYSLTQAIPLPEARRA